MGMLDGFISLFSKTNKVGTADMPETEEGIISERVPQLELSISDDDLIKLSDTWEKAWADSAAKKELERKQEENEKYWLGDHATAAQKQSRIRPNVDNLIFESVETFLPVITRQYPEPVVTDDGTPEGKEVSKKVGDRLKDIADVLRLRLKVRKAVRHWALYYLGCIKMGFSMERNDITVQVVRPQQLILDPDAITDECEYFGERVGHYRTDTAEDLMTRFPSKADYIKLQVNGLLGTRIRYIEWWTPDYLFWKLKGVVLAKAKNPHWNYDQEVETEEMNPETGEMQKTTQTIPALNFFSHRKVPFAFLSVFNIGKYPFDDTGLVEQSLPAQDRINKRVVQIDKNADNTNSGAVVSGDSFTKDDAKLVTDALRRGSTVWVPRGDVNKAYKRDTGVPLPNFVYESLIDTRNELRGIFGVTGLSPQGIKNEKTVRGKIIVGDRDTSRSAPVVDNVEQLYDYIFNWMVQLMYVYYDEPRKVSREQGTVMLSNQELFQHPQVVSVKEGSLIPKDRLAERNEAIDLWGGGALDPITLYEKLEFPNPEESARKLFLWLNNPIALFPDLQQQQQQQMMDQMAAQAQLPPEGQPQVPPETKPPEGQPNLLNQVPIQ